jgi:hypothetical protein
LWCGGGGELEGGWRGRRRAGDDIVEGIRGMWEGAGR